MSCRYTCAREGDPSAQRYLVESLRPRIEKMAAYYARCTGEDADDLRQEAWYGLLEALKELDTSIGQPDQYLVQRARWRMLDTIKRARVRRCAPLDESFPLNDKPRDKVLSHLSLSRFTTRLKQNQKDVLTCLMGGLTWRETGDRLGCTSANVAYHVRQIRKEYEEWSNS